MPPVRPRPRPSPLTGPGTDPLTGPRKGPLTGPLTGPRTSLARLVERAASAASRRLGRGSGEVIGGRLALRLAPDLLRDLSAGRAVACVSGTNGKTTTTRMLAAALGAAGPVASNAGGANMAPGVAAALCRAPAGAPAALEVDEIWLPRVALATSPRVIALLNLSRDQLDRSNETRRIAGLWRDLGGRLPDCTVVANADDPLVTWAAQGFAHARWVGAGQVWTADSAVCPACGELLRREADGDWHCACGLRRPATTIRAAATGRVCWEGRTLDVPLALPGRVNTANALMAAATAEVLGVPVEAGLSAAGSLTDVQGRYATVPLAPGVSGRLLLAKNPAGWLEMVELLDAAPPRPVLIAFNAREADGRDPSWLWDVPVERLAGRPVHVVGDRREDVAVRCAYAGVDCTVHDTAAGAAGAAGAAEVDVLATYTAFRDLLRETGGLA